MKEPTKMVAFRLSQPDLARLAREASKYGLSPGTYARRLVVEKLDDENERRLLKELVELHELVSLLRGDLATATMALLTHAGRTPADEAEKFAKRALLRSA